MRSWPRQGLAKAWVVAREADAPSIGSSCSHAESRTRRHSPPTRKVAVPVNGHRGSSPFHATAQISIAPSLRVGSAKSFLP